MKYLLLFTACIAFSVCAQKPLTATFRLSYMSQEEPPYEVSLKVSQRPDQMAVTLNSEFLQEYMIVDSKQKKLLELIEEPDEEGGFYKDAYPETWASSLSDEIVTLSSISDLFLATAADSDFELLDEKRIINGLNCVKIRMIQDGQEAGTGWVAKELTMEVLPDFGFLRTTGGTIVEFSFISPESSFICVMTGYVPDSADADFSFEIPEGYIVSDKEIEVGNGEE